MLQSYDTKKTAAKPGYVAPNPYEYDDSESATAGLTGAAAGVATGASMGGMAAAALTGATAGSVVPVWGTLIGAGVGLVAGAIIGSEVNREEQRKVQDAKRKKVHSDTLVKADQASINRATVRSLNSTPDDMALGAAPGYSQTGYGKMS